jgi:hypothetical protein
MGPTDKLWKKTYFEDCEIKKTPVLGAYNNFKKRRQKTLKMICATRITRSCRMLRFSNSGDSVAKKKARM